MPESPSTTGDKIPCFWDCHITKTDVIGINPPFDRWIVVCAEQYITAPPDHRLTEYSSANVDG